MLHSNGIEILITKDLSFRHVALNCSIVLMMMTLLKLTLSLDLTALDGAEVLVLPAVELGEHADHPPCS